jgi:hypothetical protein
VSQTETDRDTQRERDRERERMENGVSGVDSGSQPGVTLGITQPRLRAEWRPVQERTFPVAVRRPRPSPPARQQRGRLHAQPALQADSLY